MATQTTYFLIRVWNYCPRIGHSLSEKDGWFVGPKRFCGEDKALRFETEAEAQEVIESRYKGRDWEFEITKVQGWVD